MFASLMRQWREARSRTAASRWLVRMHGSRADQWRDRFEAWRADPVNARAYAVQESIWAAAPGLRAERIGSVVRPRSTALRLALAALALVLFVAVVALRRSPEEAPVQIAALGGQMRTESLPDGSRVIVDRGGIVDVQVSRGRREFTLGKGRARFEIAPSATVATIRAGHAMVETGSAKIDIAVENEGTRIVLLAGLVRLARFDGSDREEVAVALAPGEEIILGDQGLPAIPAKAAPARLAWPQGVITFDDTRIFDLVAQSNRSSFTPIRIGTSSIGDLRVTGVYRAGDNEGLARNLAESFGLIARPRADGSIVIDYRRPNIF